MPKVHHSAIVTHDLEASLAFWRDGLGLDLLMDHTFKGPWDELFGGTTTELRSLFLGDAASPDSGIVELVDTGETGPPAPGPRDGSAGFMLLSLYADLDQVLPRLATLGVGGEATIRPVGPVRLAVVRDPNGVTVELMDMAARQNLDVLAGGQQ